MKYFLNAWKNFNVTDGRSTRAEFWTFYGITLGVMVAQILLASALYSRRMDTLAAVVFISLLVHVAPYFSLIVRRLHDIGLSSWFSLFFVVPYFLQLILLIMHMSINVGMFGQSVVYSGNETVLSIFIVMSYAATLIFGLMDSKPGMNKYGPNPKEVALAKKMQEAAMNGQQFQNVAPQQFNNMGQHFGNEVQFQNVAPQQFNNMEQQFQNEMPQQYFENQNLQNEVTTHENVVNPNSEELAKIEKMYQDGILTQGEFEVIKNRLTSN